MMRPISPNPTSIAEENRIRELLRIYTKTSHLTKLAPDCKKPLESPSKTVKQLPPFEKFTFRYRPSTHRRTSTEVYLPRLRPKGNVLRKSPFFEGKWSVKGSFSPRSPGSDTTECTMYTGGTFSPRPGTLNLGGKRKLIGNERGILEFYTK